MDNQCYMVSPYLYTKGQSLYYATSSNFLHPVVLRQTSKKQTLKNQGRSLFLTQKALGILALFLYKQFLCVLPGHPSYCVTNFLHFFPIAQIGKFTAMITLHFHKNFCCFSNFDLMWSQVLVSSLLEDVIFWSSCFKGDILKGFDFDVKYSHTLLILLFSRYLCRVNKR